MNTVTHKLSALATTVKTASRYGSGWRPSAAHLHILVPAKGIHRRKLTWLRGAFTRLPFGIRRDLRDALAVADMMLPAALAGGLCVVAGILNPAFMVAAGVLFAIAALLPSALLVGAVLRGGQIWIAKRF